jgi:hypothetical protein
MATGEMPPGSFPTGYAGMTPAAQDYAAKTAVPTHPDPRAIGMAEQSALATRTGIGAVPPRRKGGRTK